MRIYTFMEEFDLIVIGEGPAGYAAAMHKIDIGKNNCSIFKSCVFKNKLACYSLVDGVKTPLERI